VCVRVCVCVCVYLSVCLCHILSLIHYISSSYHDVNATSRFLLRPPVRCGHLVLLFYYAPRCIGNRTTSDDISAKCAGNVVGLSSDMKTAVPNACDGVRSSADYVLIGSSGKITCVSTPPICPQANTFISWRLLPCVEPNGGNIIAGNYGNGITINRAGFSGHFIFNNFIGTNGTVRPLASSSRSSRKLTTSNVCVCRRHSPTSMVCGWTWSRTWSSADPRREPTSFQVLLVVLHQATKTHQPVNRKLELWYLGGSGQRTFRLL
jgi:hypothetical protein